MTAKLGQYMKTIETVIGVLLMVGATFLTESAHLPASVTAAVTAGVGVLTAVKVWLVKNEPLIEEASDAVVELGKGVASAGKPA